MTQPPSNGPDRGGWAPQPADQPVGPQGWAPQPEPKPRRRTGLIASIAAVVVLAGGGAATYVALSSSSDNGAASPKQAVQKMIGDLEKSDLVGFLDDLAPGERDALSSRVRDDIDRLKQLGVVKSGANPASLTAVSFAAHNLTYANKTITINDHVQIVALTGGTLDVQGDAAKLFTSRFIKSAGGSARRLVQSTHIDIAAAVRSSGQPIRIATVQVGDRWYPSLFYTVADQAAGHAVPSASDAVAATGAASGEQAVRLAVEALLKGDLRSVLGLISPSELGAVHDYGGMLLRQAGSGLTPTDVTIKSLELTSTPISGGAQRIGLKHLVLRRRDGTQLSITLRGSCLAVAAAGHSQQFCAAQLSQFIPLLQSQVCSGGASISISTNGVQRNLPQRCNSKPPTAAQKQAITDLFSSFTEVGIVTTQSGGKWFLAPVRTVADLGSTVLSGLKGDDLFELMHLGA